MNFDKNLFKNYRLFCGMTQKDFADLVGVKATTVQAWETGRATPPEHQLQNINRVINQKLATFNNVNAKEVNFGNVVNVEKNFVPSSDEHSEKTEIFRSKVISALIDADIPPEILHTVLKIVKNVK